MNAIAAYLRRRKMRVAKHFGTNSPDGALRVSLCDIDPMMVRAWTEMFHDTNAVEVVEGSIADLDCDAVVSPANSFGDMGGGVDRVIDELYNGEAQRQVSAGIRARFFGEMPVGMAMVTPIRTSSRFPYLITAPTMRTPGSVQGTLNAYLAFRAALVVTVRFNREQGQKIATLAVPGMCTGVGGMEHKDAAEQMRAAYVSIIGGGWEHVVHPAMAPYPLGPGALPRPTERLNSNG